MKKGLFSIVGLTATLMGLFVFFNYTLASSIGDGGIGGSGSLTISDIKITRGVFEVGVDWKTNQPTTTWIAYRATGEPDWIILQTGLDTTLVTVHKSGTPRLIPGQAYQYYVFGNNASGTTVRSSEDSFTMTSSIPDYFIPYINVSVNGGSEQLFSTDPIAVGVNLSFRIKVDNYGNMITPTTSGVLLVDGVPVGTTSVNAIDVGGRGQANTLIPWTTTVGLHTLKFIIDPENSVLEHNESNNSWTGTLRVGSGETPGQIQIKDLGATGVTFQSAVVKWRTNVETDGLVYYLATSHNNSSTTISTVSTSTANWLIATDTKVRTNHEVILRNLSPQTKYRYYVISSTEAGLQARSEIKDFETRSKGPHDSDDLVTTTPKYLTRKPMPREMLVPPTLSLSSDIRALQERIKKLQLRISELESKLIEREKSLAQPKDKKLTDRVKGKILLQVQDNGEAWYIDPITEKKYYFKDGNSAYQAMQAFGLGISNVDLAKIPVGTDAKTIDQDTDQDGVSDSTETAIGTDPTNPDSDADGFKDGEEISNDYSPLGQAKMPKDSRLQERLKGRIVLQVEGQGKAWYINPADGKRYFLGNGAQAYKIMRYLSTGATNDDLRKIEVGDLTTEE